MNTSWLLSLDKIKSNFDECTMSINYKKYRTLQIIVCLKKFFKDPQEYKTHSKNF